MTTLIASIDMAPQGSGTASADSGKCPSVMCREPADRQLMFELFDDLGQFEWRFHPSCINWSRVDCCFWGGILAYFK
jgi:hypothetical protein